MGWVLPRVKQTVPRPAEPWLHSMWGKVRSYTQRSRVAPESTLLSKCRFPGCAPDRVDFTF